MFSCSRRTWPGFRRGRRAAILVAACLWAELGLAQEFSSATASVVPGVLRSFDDIWHLPDAAQKQWHRVRLEYVVYYYDPLWQAMWGRSGEADSYLSLGSKVFPIRPGQRILVEGFMQPARGMRVEEPTVTVLADSVPVEVLATRGEISNTQRFNKRLVTVEAYVDRQVIRDANHVELHAIAEGRPVVLQLLLKNDTPVPQLRDSFVRAKGVYFARSEDATALPKIEVWVQRSEDLELVGTLDRDERFSLPSTPLDQLAGRPPAAPVHVTGVARERTPGESLVIEGDGVRLVLLTVQSAPVGAGEQVEAVGWPAQEGGRWVLKQTLYRPAQGVLTSVRDIWELPESARQRWHRVRIDMLIYYYDPFWRAVWGQAAGSNDYLSLGAKTFPIKPGQRVRMEGSVFPANNVVIENPTVTVLAEAVPLEPQPTEGRVGDTRRFDKALVTLEGYVDRQVLTDPRHVELDLVAEGRLVIGRVLLPDGATAPTWEGARVRLTGVYSVTQDPTGAAPSIELWTAGPQHVTVLGSLDDDERFRRDALPVEKLVAAELGSAVRVVGIVRGQQPGRSLTVRDDTGQVVLRTAQARAVQIGETVEAVGVVAVDNGERTLREALFRRAATVAVAPTTGLPKLRLADQLRELSAEEAARSFPVQLSGLVTWASAQADFFFIRDGSGGVCVYRPAEFTAALPVGAKVELTGVSGAGKFTPVVLASAIQVSGSVELPEARPVTLEQALTGVEEAQWVSMSGYVRSVEQEQSWTRLELTTSAGEFQALLSRRDRWSSLRGAVVRLRGVCSAVANAKRQLTGVRLWVGSSQFVEVEEAAPDNPFQVGMRSIASLRQFGAVEGRNRRIGVSGIVVHQSPGRLVHLQDGSEGLLVLSRDMTPLALGDRIEAVGFPGRENRRLVLREAVYRRVGAGEEPKPVALSGLAPIDAELDGRLVRVEAALLDVGAQENGVRFIGQQDRAIFEALLDVPRDQVPEHCVPGSQLALTGVYEIQFDEYRRPHAVSLRLRTPADVQVLRRPPWWTMQRMLAVTGVLGVAVVLGLGWVAALRRRVRQQTAVIGEKLESEKAARLEAALARTSKLESLGVLAGGIAHDFNNLLTVIVGNISLAKLDPNLEPDSAQCLTESERAARRARDLTQQLLTFAKGGAPVRSTAQLPELVREAAQFALHGAKVRCEFDIAADLWPADVDKGQIGQVVHNIILNANQAMPDGGRIEIALRNEEIVGDGRPGLAAGRYVRISLRDSGSGISAEYLPRIFEPYFTTKKTGSGLGLATVYSIVKKHQGHVEVQSAPGQGTTFHIWLPAAAGTSQGPVAPAPKARKTETVLLMDDEATIRQMAGAVLKRMGLAVTAVNDGAAVVEAYRAARAAGRPFDLVILDLTVPGGMGGAEAMRRLREMDPNVRAIVSSGYSSDPVMADYRAHGFCGRIPKPYTAPDLMAVITALMRTAGDVV